MAGLEAVHKKTKGEIGDEEKTDHEKTGGGFAGGGSGGELIDQTIEATKDLEERPGVLILEPLGDSVTNYGASSLGGDMVTKLGAQLANPDAKTVGKEDIIAANPDVIFVVYMPYASDDPETVKETQLATIRDDEALQSLNAVKNGRIVPIMLSEMYASATRTQDGIEHFAAGLYPELNQ